jgi:hypothetical protein
LAPTSIDRVKALLRKLLIRLALCAGGCAAMGIAIWLNVDAGPEIFAGLLSPESPMEIAVSVARLIPAVVGLWLLYRGLH